MKTQENTLLVPHLAAPEGTQAEVDKTQAKAVATPTPASDKPRGPTMFVIVRQDNGKPIAMASGDKWYHGKPLRAESGEWLKLKREVAVQLAAGLELKEKESGLTTRVVPDFVYRREQREGKEATSNEVAGLMKTLFGHGGVGVTDAASPKSAPAMAAAFAAANGGKAPDPASFGKPEKPSGKRGSGKRDSKSRRHDRDDD